MSIIFCRTVSNWLSQEHVWEIGDDTTKLELLIEQFLENRSNLPTKRDFDHQTEMMKEEIKLNGLTAEDILREFEDPHIHYLNNTRTSSQKYKDNVKYFLLKQFPMFHHNKIVTIMKNNNSLLVPSFKECEVLPVKGKGKGKGRKSNPKEPDNMDPDFIKEVMYLRLEQQIRDLQHQRIETINKAKASGKIFECNICCNDECLLSEAINCENGCIFCFRCLKKGAEIQIGENKSRISCLMSCGSFVSLNTLASILPRRLVKRLTENQQLQDLEAAKIDNLFQCRSCNFAIIIPPDSDEKVIVCKVRPQLSYRNSFISQKTHLYLHV